MSEKKAPTPVLNAYIARIGAEKLNFRRYIVRDYRGNYYHERALIRLDAKGKISCTTSEHAPTKEEEGAIAEEIIKISDSWPKATGAKNIMKLKLSRDSIFEFWDLKRKDIIMVQERRGEGAGKSYHPWTFFSDGIWYPFEPDGKLPFWKPKEKRNKAKIMVHEGAKAANFCDQLVNDPKRKKELKAHPYGETLVEYEHWGMIGGALAPHRTDYSELITESPVEVIYVCDNDPMGNAALQLVSKYYSRPMKGVRFGKDFPHSFDLADGMPALLFSKGRWVGPAFKSLMQFATFATETIPAGKKGRPVTKLRQWFIDEWVHSVTPDAYAHIDWPHRIYSETEFNDFVAPFSDVAMTSSLVKKQGSIKSAILSYDPSAPPGLYAGEHEGMFFNTYCPSVIKPERGDISPFIDYLKHLIPIDYDRANVMKWLSTLIARPEIKMVYAMLLISETQGVGKSTLGEHILEPILGKLNVSYPTESDIVDGDYTYWMAHKRLAFCNEIYAGHNSKAYNKLKDVITGKKVTIKRKYMADYSTDNWIHVIACSNNFNAIRLSGDDRRWFVPTVTEEKRTTDYWIKFNKWLTQEGGLNFIAQWAFDYFDVENNEPIGRGDAAPKSTAKHRVIEEGYSDGMHMVAHILKIFRERGLEENQEFYRCVMMDTDLIKLIHENVYDSRPTDKLERASTIRRIAQDCHWYVGTDRTQFRDGTRGRLICLSPEDAKKKPNALFKEIIPTRIRLLGKKVLSTDESGALNIAREDLEDPLAVEARHTK